MKLKLVLIGLVIAGINHCTHAIEPEREPATRYSAVLEGNFHVFNGYTAIVEADIRGDLRIWGEDTRVKLDNNTRVRGHIYLMGTKSAVRVVEGCILDGNIYRIGEGSNIGHAGSEFDFVEQFLYPKVVDRRLDTEMAAMQAPDCRYKRKLDGTILIYGPWLLRNTEVNDVYVLGGIANILDTRITGNLTKADDAECKFSSRAILDGRIITDHRAESINDDKAESIIGRDSEEPEDYPQDEVNLVQNVEPATPAAPRQQRLNFLRRLAWCCS